MWVLCDCELYARSRPHGVMRRRSASARSLNSSDAKPLKLRLLRSVVASSSSCVCTARAVDVDGAVVQALADAAARRREEAEAAAQVCGRCVVVDSGNKQR